MKLSEIAQKLGCRVEGPADTEIAGVAGIDHAKPGHITFLANRRYFPLLKTTEASAILLQHGIKIQREPGAAPVAALRSENPYLDFARAIELFYQPPRYAPGIHPTAVIAKSARVGDGAHIGPYLLCGRRRESDETQCCIVSSTIYRGAKIGDNFFAHAHAERANSAPSESGDPAKRCNYRRVTAWASQSEKTAAGTRFRNPGAAVLEDDVEVQANACVDRATVGETRIGSGTKLDDMVLIGHASTVGKNAMLCGQVGLAGSTHIGNGCILAGQVGSSGHLTLGRQFRDYRQERNPRDVPAGAMHSGIPAVENRLWLKSMAALYRLPELQKRFWELEAEVEKSKARKP